MILRRTILLLFLTSIVAACGNNSESASHELIGVDSGDAQDTGENVDPDAEQPDPDADPDTNEPDPDASPECDETSDCGDNEECEDGVCIAVPICEPNANRCDQNDLLTCSPDGLEEFRVACPQACSEGECIERCQVGEQQCLGENVFRVCAEDGNWIEQECGDTATCDPETNSCVGEDCISVSAGCRLAESQPYQSSLLTRVGTQVNCLAQVENGGFGSSAQGVWEQLEGESLDFNENSAEISFFLPEHDIYELQWINDEEGIFSTPPCEYPKVRIETEAPGENDLIITLTWEPEIVFDQPTDMDLHLIRLENAWNDENNDCFHRAPNPDWGRVGDPSDDPSLFDSLTEETPESIYFGDPTPNITYTLAVNFINNGNIGAATAHVEVTLGGQELHSITFARLERQQVWIPFSFSRQSEEGDFVFTEIDELYSEWPNE